MPGGSSVYLIIHTVQGDGASGSNVINPRPLSAVPALCAEVEMITVREDQIVSTESSLVSVVRKSKKRPRKSKKRLLYSEVIFS